MIVEHLGSLDGCDFSNFPPSTIWAAINFKNTQYQAALYQARVYAQRANYHKVKADNAADALEALLAEQDRMEEDRVRA